MLSKLRKKQVERDKDLQSSGRKQLRRSKVFKVTEKVERDKGLQVSETLQNRAMLSIALCRLLRKGI